MYGVSFSGSVGQVAVAAVLPFGREGMEILPGPIGVFSFFSFVFFFLLWSKRKTPQMGIAQTIEVCAQVREGPSLLSVWFGHWIALCISCFHHVVGLRPDCSMEY